MAAKERLLTSAVLHQQRALISCILALSSRAQVMYSRWMFLASFRHHFPFFSHFPMSHCSFLFMSSSFFSPATTGPFSESIEELCGIGVTEVDESRIAFMGEMQYANLSEADIAYYRFSSESGRESGRPAVVLVNGFGGTTMSWPLWFLEDLAEQHEVVVYDNRAMGRSTGSITNVTIMGMAQDAAELAMALDLEKPTLIGWSMGGMIAIDAAIMYEDIWGRVVVISGSPGGLSSAPPPYSAILSSYYNGSDGIVAFQQLFPIVADTGAYRDLRVGWERRKRTPGAWASGTSNELAWIGTRQVRP